NPFDTRPEKPRPYIFSGPQSAPRPTPAQQPSLSPQSVTNIPPPPPVAQREQPKPLGDDVDPDTIGSTNVPMDSWIYPALERLAAMGSIPAQSTAIRPWPRQECLRQLRLADALADVKDAYSPSL